MECVADSLITGIVGPWGSGKSSLANLVLAEIWPRLEKLNRPDPPSGTGRLPLVVELNAWQTTPAPTLWSSWVNAIGAALYSRLMEAVANNQPIEYCCPQQAQTVRLDRNRLKKNRLLDPRLPWTEFAGRLSDAISKYWHPCLLTFCEGRSKLQGRALDVRDGIKQIFKLVGRYVKGDDLQTLKTVVKSVELLLGSPTAVSFPADSPQFTKSLDELLAAFLMPCQPWRLVVIVDDTARMDRKRIPELQAALGRFSQMSGVLVLITLDQLSSEALHSAGQTATEGETDEAPVAGERFDTRLFAFRSPMPSIGANTLARLIERWWFDLKFPFLPFRREYFIEAFQLGGKGRPTPRQLKRALLWMWIRLTDPREKELLKKLRNGTQCNSLIENVLHSLASCQRTLEDPPARTNEWIDGLKRWGKILVEFSVRPWDGCAWTDRVPDWSGADEHSISMAISLRLFEALDFVGAYTDNYYLEITEQAQSQITAWTVQARQDFPVEIAEADIDNAVPILLDAFMSRSFNFLPVLRHSFLGRAVEAFQLTHDPLPTEAEEVLKCWMLPDRLALIAGDDQGKPRSRKLALTLLCAFHPFAAKLLLPGRGDRVPMVLDEKTVNRLRILRNALVAGISPESTTPD